MQSILLKNFKSYQYQALTDLNSRINVILGSNGQGKSNFFKAFSFLFTDRFTINRNQFAATLNKNVKSQTPQIVVEANLSQNFESSKPYKLGKTWTNQTIQEFEINNKLKGKEQFQNFIESFGLSITSPYNIVQQGKLAQIAQMNESQLYLLLQDVAGVKKYNKRSELAQSNLRKVEMNLAQAQQNLRFLKDKVGQVQFKKNQYEFYQVEQKVRRLKKKRQLQISITNINRNVEKMKENHLRIIKELEESKIKQKDTLCSIDEKETLCKILVEKALFYQKQNSELLESTVLKKQLLNNKKQRLQILEKKKRSHQLEIKQNLEKLINLEKELDAYRGKYQLIKVDFQAQKQSKDTKKVKQAYQAKIQTEKQSIKQIQDELNKLNKIQSQFKSIDYSVQTKQIQILQNQLIPINESLKKLQIQQIQLARTKMNRECEIQTIAGKKKHLDETIKKILPMIDFRLQKLLVDEKVDGVYGYLIEHLKINQAVAFAYQLVGLAKLCTLLVQDDKVAAKVVNLNKKIHGKNINILPLSYVKSQITEKRSIPKMENVFSLVNQDWIQILNESRISMQTKASIQKVVNNTFSKYVLVQDYLTALKISKQYNLNCITGDREIVYAQAFMCKVGRQQTFQKGKIELFSIQKNMGNQIKNLKNELMQIQKKFVQIQNQQLQLINEKQSLNLKINKLQKFIDQAKNIQSIKIKLQEKKLILENSIHKSNRIIKQYQSTLLNIQNNIKTKFKQEDYNQAYSDYFYHKSKVENLQNENYEKQKALIILLKQHEILLNQLNQTSNTKQSTLNLQTKEQILKQIENEKRKLEEQSANLNQQLTKEIQNRNRLQEKQMTVLAELTIEQENQKDIIKRLESLGDFDQEQQEEIQELSNSISQKLNTNSLNAKKKMFYTARDKVFFTKINQYIDKVKFFSDQTLNIKKAKINLEAFIQKATLSSKQHIKSFTAEFEKHFIYYFLKFVPNGKVQWKTKIFSQNVKGINKNGYSLDIKVSFNEEEGIRKWSQFSGGQKSVLSLCIILGIQKCEPAPFCVFDEVDSALDPFYSSKLIDIILQESRSCQYFITSFKKSMLQFPEKVANYYLVKTAQRISNITRIQRSQAQSIIDEIAV